MNKSMRIVFLSAILICMLAMPAMANYNSDGWPVNTKMNGTVNGGVFHDSIGWTETTTQTLTTDVPNGTVKYAYLYTGVWGGHSTGWVNVSFNGDSTSNKLGPIHLEETNDGNDNVWCTGLGKYWLWYNVTNLVNTGQINTATTSKINGSIDGRIYGIVLVVVYEGGDDPKQIQYWINDGSDALSSTNPTGTTNFVGTVNTDNIAMANLTMVHLTGYYPSCSNCTKFNGNELDTSGVNTNEFDMHTWNVTNYMKASGNDAWFSQGFDAHVNICNTILTVEYEPELNAPDLNVNDVLVNPGNERYEDIVRVYINQSNNISAVVYNNGPEDVTDDFDVCFEADGLKIGCSTVTGGLSAGANTTISIDWTPTCADYPVMAGFPAQSLPLTINVTVDCNCSNCPTCPDGSCGTITESDETNNIFSKVIPAIQVYNTINVIGGVVDNGYKSKNLDCDTTEEPLDQFMYYNLIGGGVEYNVSGAKISSFDPEATDTRIHHIDLPSGATVKDARLYVYWYDKWYNFNTYPTGCLANLSVNFSGTDLIPDTVYQDSKSFGFYQSPKGSSVFNVTSLMSGSGDYTAIVKNIEPIGGNGTTLLGEMLVVIYDRADHGHEVQIWMLEGTDYLMSADDTHGSKDFSVSPEEATATVALSGGTIDPANVNTARLITVVAQGMELGSDMLFNGNVIKADAWDTPTEAYPGSKINVENVSVKSNLLESGNNMGFQDNGTTGMQASNAILIVETPVIVETPLPDLVVSNIHPQYIFTNLTNVLSVNVMNQGTASTASCNVSLNISHTGGPTVLIATVPALNASESTVVEVGNWKPTVLENISMTAFVDSGGVVDEGANEINNNLTVSRNTTGDCAVDDMLPDTCFGYRGDNPMTTAYEGTGGVIYSVGDFKYKNNTVSFSIGSSGDENQVDGSTAEIPTGATIKNATLYVYYTYRKSATGPNPGADPRPDYEMSINGGSTLTTDEYYTDVKGFTSSEYQYGTLVYDVTANVAGNGAYQAVRSNCDNTDPVLKGKGYVSGMALMVIYDDGSDNTYSIAHGYDRLATFYSTQYKVLPEDAATTATLTDVDPNLIATANMLTVTVDAVASGSESQQFNAGSWEVGAWDCIAGVPDCGWNYPLGINRGAVDKSDITASGTDEVVKFQEGTSNGFAPVFACLQTRAPDLVVSNIYPQYIFTNLTNVFSVNVMNQGTASTASCEVNLTITHTGGPTVLTATVPALNAGESAEVEVGNWKPTVLENISMTTFADSGGVVDEGANEINNNLTVSRNTTGDCAVDDMLPDTCFGYRGDNPMTTAYEGTGGVIYSVGDFKYKNNTVNFNIGTSGDENQVDGSTAEVPTDATIKNATLYVYYTYRKSATGPNPGVDPRPDYEMSINGGSILTTDDYYTDIKGFITSEYQYGTLVYDVTANVTGNGAYQAVRSNCNNTDPVLKGKGYVSGMALMIIYDDGSDNTYAIDHGYDRLATSYKTEYNVLPEDATTTATLTDVDPNLIATANMLTVTVDAVASGSESQQFNTGSWEVGAWDCIAGVPDCGWNYPLGINRGAVDKSDITASGTDEVVKFQERTSNGFAPVFACLQTRAPDPTPPSNGGSGGSGGGGASGELYGNIASSETNRQYVNQNSDISYSFELECNIVQFVKFTSLKSAGKIATKVEILKDTSALVDNPPLDIVYKNLNIWVGNAGWGTKRNIADATVVFTVDKSWITENNIDETSIALYRYSDDTWHELVTRKISEDSNSLQFEAETPGFSPFAVTGKEFEEELGGEGIIPEPTVTAETTPTPTDDGGIPGFSLFAGLSILLIAVQLLRKK